MVELDVDFTDHGDDDDNEQNRSMRRRSLWLGLLDWLDAPWTRRTLERLTLRLSYIRRSKPLEKGDFAELAWRLASLPLLRRFHLHVDPGLSITLMDWGEVYALTCCTKGRCASLEATVEEKVVREWLTMTTTNRYLPVLPGRLRLYVVVVNDHGQRDLHGLPSTKELDHAPTTTIRTV